MPFRTIVRRPLPVQRHILFLVIGLLLPVLTFSAAVLVHFSATERDRHEDVALEIARRAASAVDRELAAMRAGLQALATSPYLQTGDFAAFTEQARSVVPAGGPSIVVADAEGRQLANTRAAPGQPLPPVGDMEPYRQVFETGRPYVSDLYRSALTGRWLVTVNVPVMRGGGVAMVINMSMTPERLAEVLGGQGLQADWTGAVVDRRYRIVARSRQHDRFVGAEATADLRRNAGNADSGAWTGTTIEGTAVLSAYARTEAGWLVAVGIPTALVEAPLKRSLNALAAFGVAALGISALIATLFGRALARPIGALAEGGERLARGDEVTPVATSIREVDEAGRALAVASATLRQREAALRESEARLRALADNLPNGIVYQILATPDGERRFLYISRAVEAVLGVSAEAVLADPTLLYNAVPEAHRPRLAAAEAEAVASAATFYIEVPMRLGDGTERWFQIASAPRHGADGKTIWDGVVLDIDERRRAEIELRRMNESLERRVYERTEELAASEARFRAIFDTTFQLTSLLDLEGRVLVSNRTALDAVGAELSQVVGRPLWETQWWAQTPAEAQRLREQFPQAVAGRFVRYECPLVLDGPEPQLFDLSLKPVYGEDGRPLHVIVEGRDLTELKRAEAQLRQAQKMEAVGQLTGGVAHDFNNLLQAISGCLAMIVRRTDAPGVAPLVEAGQQAVDRGAKLVQQLMAFSRRQPLRPEPIDVRDRVLGMWGLLERALRADIRLVTAFEPELWPIEADPTQFELALINLAVNARDAMPEGGTLRIAAGNRAGGGPEGTDLVEVSVSDTGTGMAPEVMARVFEPFFTTKEVGKGSGLGLAVVHGIVESHHGAIVLHTTPGIGTTFELFFPAVVTAEAAPPPARPASVRGRGQRL
ncbi:MAG TPA: cache domain-containing protein, partial [Alphaproteobacteria bacterium]|nr:cache domain-containing protein [Alphaproteobacteria bacterium]